MIIIEGCAVATVDADRTEYADGHVVIDGNRIIAVGPGAAPEGLRSSRTSGAGFGGLEDTHTRVDGRGCLATPGLVNTHHHLYQWATRGLAQDETLFGWLTELYPVWARMDADIVSAASAAALGWLAKSGCTLSTDHHYVFPERAGDLLAAEIEAAARVGLRFHPCRGSMDLGRSQGGLPPDEVVEDRDTILRATEDAIDTWHDTSADAMVRIAVAPCSPFSATGDLMREAADLARRKGVRLHTHIAETLDEESFARETFGRSPVEYLDDLGWLSDDVWLAHCVHLDDAAVKRFAHTGTGVAHCPTSNARLGAGIAPIRDLLDAGAPVGLGVDGAASNEWNSLCDELRQSTLVARLRGGPSALTVRQALELGTLGGARCLGRDADLGSLEPGKLADIALWRLDGLGHAGIEDPVAALVLGPRPPLERLFVNGRAVVADDRLTRADETELARAAHTAARKLAGEVTS